MNGNKTLIITSKEDSHTDYVINKLNLAGMSDLVIRLNTEDFLGNIRFTYLDFGFIVKISDANKEFTNNDIKSVWFRRPKVIRPNGLEDSGVNEFIVQQANASLRGLYFSIHDTARWINPLPATHRARIKLQQLSLAKELGFLVPATLVTNIPSEAIRFFEEFKAICNKSLDEPNYKVNGVLYPFLTRLVKNKSELNDSIKVCPVLLQEYIDKKFDIRVIVMGDRIFAFEIESQTDDLSIVDFRGKSPDQLPHRLHELPAELNQMLFSFVKKQGLIYSALDLALTKDNKYYFIENNCNGQWLWLELLTGVQLSDYLIQLLFD